MNKKENIISMLKEFIEYSKIENQPFKVRAYKNALEQINKLNSIEKPEEIKNLPGIGKSIYDKIEHVLLSPTPIPYRNDKTDKNKNNKTEKENKEKEVQEKIKLMKVHGIGPQKAKELFDKNVYIDNLDKHMDLLNDIQKKGFYYYNDFQKKIPREEMHKHEIIIKKIIASTHKNLKFEVAGSYRRGLDKSGDIDVLVTFKNISKYKKNKDVLKKDMEHILSEIKEKMQHEKYLYDILGIGEKKLMGVCKLEGYPYFRRLDILMTYPHEYPFALLYFTGDGNFNAKLRNLALEKGYSLNEYGFITKDNKEKIDIKAKEEDDIFRFLGLRFIPPSERTGNIDFSLFSYH